MFPAMVLATCLLLPAAVMLSVGYFITLQENNYRILVVLNLVLKRD